MTIRVLLIPDCPSRAKTLENLSQALVLEGVANDASVKVIDVRTGQEAQQEGLIGSPTLLVNGVDVEGAHAGERGFALGCRTYLTDGTIAGAPSISTIRAALRAVDSTATDSIAAQQ